MNPRVSAQLTAWLAGLLLIHLVIIGLVEPTRAAETTIIDGVPHVRNGAESRDGLRTVELREVWRVGGEDDDAFFGLIPRVAADASGHAYVLDSQLCQVSVYDTDGELVRTLFREGEGPGEVRRPRDMLLLDDGRVGLIQEFPGMVVMVDGEGLPAGRLRVGGTDGGAHSLTACQGAGDRVVLSGTHQSDGGPGISLRDNFLESYDSDSTLKAHFVSALSQYDFNDFVFDEREHLPPFWFCFAAGADGSVYTVHDRDRYAITVHAPDGSVSRVIERDYEPLQRTDREYRALYGMIETAMTGMPMEVRIEVERQEAAVMSLARGIQVAVDGRLWVLSGRGARPDAPGVMAVYDVFEPSGEFAEQVALKAPHRASEVGIVLAGPDRILVIESYFESLAAQFGDGSTYGGEDGEPALPAVVCYEIAH